MSKKVYLASDHGGFELKKHLAEKLAAPDVEIVDLGPDCAASCDYPPYAQKLAAAVADGALGILICGTGLGMSMAANRFRHVRAAVCTNEFMARMARAHNNANVLCLGERVVGKGLGLAIAEVFLATDFEGGRHQRRLDQIDN